MIKWLFKYGVVVYLLNTVLLSIESTQVIGKQVFLVLMALYAIVLLINPQQVKNVILHKAFSFILILNILNVLYFFLFHSVNDIEAIKYLLARGMQFSIISCSIFFHYEYYKSRFLIHIVYTITLVVLLGLIVDPSILLGRYRGIIWNSNMLASLTSIAFAVLFLSQRKKTRFRFFLLVLFLVISLATGSRGVLVAITLSFLFKYGFSNRNMLYAFLSLGSYFLIINLQLDTSLNRFASNSLLNDRLLQYQYAYETFLQKPFVGFGLDKYAYINTEIIPDYLRGHVISAHNGYLALLTQYGIIFGSIVLFIIFKKSTQVTLYFLQSIDIKRTYLFIIVYTLLASLYETMITGINEFHTILFWFSLAFLSFSKFKKDYES